MVYHAASLHVTLLRSHLRILLVFVAVECLRGQNAQHKPNKDMYILIDPIESG